METKAEVPPPPPQPQRITQKQQQGGKISNAANGVANQAKPLVKPEPAAQMDQSFNSQNEDRKPFNQNHGNNQGGNRQNFGGRGRGMGNRFGGGRGGPGGGNNRNFQQNRNQNQNQDVSSFGCNVFYGKSWSNSIEISFFQNGYLQKRAKKIFCCVATRFLRTQFNISPPRMISTFRKKFSLKIYLLTGKLFLSVTMDRSHVFLIFSFCRNSAFLDFNQNFVKLSRGKPMRRYFFPNLRKCADNVKITCNINRFIC